MPGQISFKLILKQEKLKKAEWMDTTDYKVIFEEEVIRKIENPGKTGRSPIFFFNPKLDDN